MFLTKGMDDVQVRGAATDIFSYLVEYNPSMVREFVMQESQQNDDVSISRNVGGHVQHLGVLDTFTSVSSRSWLCRTSS